MKTHKNKMGYHERVVVFMVYWTPWGTGGWALGDVCMEGLFNFQRKIILFLIHFIYFFT